MGVPLAFLGMENLKQPKCQLIRDQFIYLCPGDKAAGYTVSRLPWDAPRYLSQLRTMTTECRWPAFGWWDRRTAQVKATDAQSFQGEPHTPCAQAQSAAIMKAAGPRSTLQIPVQHIWGEVQESEF